MFAPRSLAIVIKWLFKMAVSEEGGPLRAKETNESVNLLENEASSALAVGRDVRKGFLP